MDGGVPAYFGYRRRDRAPPTSTRPAISRTTRTIRRTPGRPRNATAPRVRLAAALAASGLLLGIGVPSAQAAEDYPTWSEVQAARSSEQATGDQVTRITSLISGLSAEVEAATALALQRADEHAAAVDALDEATGELQALESKAERAQAAGTFSKGWGA